MDKVASASIRWLSLGALLLSSCSGKQAPEPEPLPPLPSAAAVPSGPGVSVADADDEARAQTILDAVVRGQIQQALPFLGEKLMLGPAAWALVRKDAGELGKQVTFVLPSPEGDVQLPGRIVTSTDLPALLRSKNLREAMKRARARSPSAATDAERILFYQMVPFEIAGRPLTVAGDGTNRLLFWSEGGKVIHFDAIGRYKDAAVKDDKIEFDLPPS